MEAFFSRGRGGVGRAGSGFSLVSEFGQSLFADAEEMGDLVDYRDLDLFFQLLEALAHLLERLLEKKDGIGKQRGHGERPLHQGNPLEDTQKRLVGREVHLFQDLPGWPFPDGNQDIVEVHPEFARYVADRPLHDPVEFLGAQL